MFHVLTFQYFIYFVLQKFTWIIYDDFFTICQSIEPLPLIEARDS
nr:MAG TPA: hypothetical protein [Caudoviricetes sp.]